jgi:hypothetical protein
MAGELASWAKNALNHGELALDPAYTHGATLTALMVIDFLAATSTVLLLACTLVGSTRALSRLVCLANLVVFLIC